MAVLRGILLACVGGVIGAVLWAVVARYLHLEIGWLAWIVGGLCGAGMMLGAQQRAGVATGIVAAVIALVSIPVGKLTASLWVAGNVVEEYRPKSLNNEELRYILAAEVVTAWEEEGRVMTWPKVDGQAEAYADFPREVRAEIDKQWASMSKTDREALKAQKLKEIEAEATQATAVLAAAGFFSSFGALDVVFGLLAIGTAYKLGSMQPGKRAEDQAGVQTVEETTVGTIRGLPRQPAGGAAEANPLLRRSGAEASPPASVFLPREPAGVAPKFAKAPGSPAPSAPGSNPAQGGGSQQAA